jgi:hypothetical protein
MFLKIVFFETATENYENLFANQFIRPLERKYNIIFQSRTPPTPIPPFKSVLSYFWKKHVCVKNT